ncbi:MAG: glycosyltransferase family 4 protein, partial [Candidatus Omnitrophica bacterium]|nr:glycosyltransferase family 4 protein [Candidatus Omnitrophota bacterium]
LCPRDILKENKTKFISFVSLILKKADVFVVLTKEMESYLIEERIPKKRIRIIPNGVDTKIFKPLEREATISKKTAMGYKDKRIILYVGRLVQQKGLFFLLEAFKYICKKYLDTILLLVGIGPLLKELIDYVDSTGVKEKVRFLGALDSPLDFFQIADIFVLPSQQEGITVALLEAMACGLPCVVTEASRPIVQNKENGIIVPFANPEALSSAILEILNDSRLAYFLGKNARKLVVENYDIDMVATRYTHLFESLLENA